eukprot:578569-Prymnesium_polylepis.1
MRSSSNWEARSHPGIPSSALHRASSLSTPRRASTSRATCCSLATALPSVHAAPANAPAGEY